jgi:BirA family transcriptional regulator, biotin operon repressor / biotin---[acetyl-CoA-carboxylase] ligase
MLGRPRVHHRLTDSTNQRAKELAAAGAPHGTLVTASEQTAGRGRQGRTWSAPPGKALLMSLIVRDLAERHAILPLTAAVAACEACEAVASVRCEIKWPNDIWVDGRKLAGILIEGRPQEGWAVLGIGLNVATRADEFPEELRRTATSLGLDAAAVDEVLFALLERLEVRLADSPDVVLEAWRSRDALRGRRVRWNDSNEGTAAGIDDSGALVVETDSGPVKLDAGEVHLSGVQS